MDLFTFLPRLEFQNIKYSLARALDALDAQNPEEELSFNKGDILCVRDSHVINESSSTQESYCWHASKKDEHELVFGNIPRQLRYEEHFFCLFVL